MGVLYVVNPDPKYFRILDSDTNIDMYKYLYKAGMSANKNNDLIRIKGYGKKAVIILLASVKNYITLEKILLNKLKIKFGDPVIGRECFKCNTGNCIEVIRNIFNEVLNMDDKVDGDVFDEKIKDIFPKYYEDECFGGDKKLVSFKYNKKYTYECDNVFERNDKLKKEIIINYYYIEYEYDQPVLREEEHYVNCNYTFEHWNKLRKQQIIENNKVYNLNNTDFLESIHNLTKKINVTFSPKNKKLMDEQFKPRMNVYGKIMIDCTFTILYKHILYPDIIVNENYYASFLDLSDENHLTLDIKNYESWDNAKYMRIMIECESSPGDYQIHLIKIDNNWYDKDINNMFIKICPRIEYKRLCS